MSNLEISTMSKTERLQTMEAIWDTLIHESTEAPSPEWHGDVLAERRLKIAEGRATFVPIEALRSRPNR